MYLQMDGVDDWLRTPQLTLSRIVMEFAYEPNNPPATTAYYLFDARGGSPNGNYMVYINHTTNGVNKGGNISTVNLDGIPYTNQVLSTGTRYKIDATFVQAILSEANGVEFFVNYAFQNTTRVKGKLYRITGYNGSNVIFDYDMSKGTIQDQSGNGNHATLTGGTWISDTPTGSDVSYQYNTKQTLYSAVAFSMSTKQAISANRQYYFTTAQSLYSDFVSFSTSYPVRIFVSGDKYYSYPTEQIAIANRFESFSTKQALYRIEVVEKNTKQVIYKNSVTTNQLKQVIPILRSYEEPILIKVYDPDKTVIGTIALKGSRELIVRIEGSIEKVKLQGERVPVIRLEGGL
jgi:hypothetical protein